VPDKQVDSVCPYCGVGCQLTYNVKDNKILFVEGRDGPANHGRLCVKGRYGFDYAHHPHRLTKPLIRRADAPKTGDFTMDPDRVLDVFREASWEEALALAGGKLRASAIRTAQGAGRLRLGQGQQRRSLPVPEAGAHRLRQQQRRPLHAPVPRLVGGGAAGRHRFGRRVEPGDGRDAGRGDRDHRRQSDREPSGGRHLDQERGAQRHQAGRLRPAPSELARQAHRYLQFKPDTDVALLNAMMHVIVTKAWSTKDLHRQPHHRLRGTAQERGRLQPGADGADLRHRRRDHARYGAPVRNLEGSMILWGMGVSQHVHGTDNARCLIALALMTGQIGRPGTGCIRCAARTTCRARPMPA
jgi:formate dehydrogenase major subunit